MKEKVEFTTIKPEKKGQAIESLPKIEDVNKQFNKILSPLEVGRKEKHSWQKELSFPRSRRKMEFSPTEYEQFKIEFQEDLDVFHLQIQRLRIRLLKYYLRGSTKDIDSDLSWEEKDETWGGRLWHLAVDCRHANEKGELTEEDKKKLFAELNKRLPNEYNLKMLENFSQIDYEMLADFASSIQYGEPPKGKEEEILEHMLSEVGEIEGDLENIEKQGELFVSVNDKTFVHEDKMIDLSDRYRKLLKRFAGYEESESWHSPTYGTSKKGQRGKDQSSSRSRTDYQRLGMWEMEDLESRLNNVYFKKSEYEEYVHSYLYNNGLNALKAILSSFDKSLAGEKKYKEKPKVKLKAIKTKDIYFEVDYLIEDYFEQKGIPLEEMNPEDTESLIKKIKKDLPFAVFLNPMSNMYDMKVVEVRKILEALTADRKWRSAAREKLSLGWGERSIVIVLDNTTLGRLAKWKDFNFRRLPDFVKIISFESLVKYAQAGQELSAGALVTTIGRYADDYLRSIRGREGFTPTENTVRKLQIVTESDVTDMRMQRFSRNAGFVGKQLEKSVKSPNSMMSEVHYPGLKSHPQHKIVENEMAGAGGLLSVGFDFEFLKTDLSRRTGFRDSVREIANGFINLSIAIAKEVGIEINQGTSFGFNITRMAVYERVIEGEKEYEYQEIPYIRLSIGTENIKDTKLIVEILKRVNEIFGIMKKEGAEELVDFARVVNEKDNKIILKQKK